MKFEEAAERSFGHAGDFRNFRKSNRFMEILVRISHYFFNATAAVCMFFDLVVPRITQYPVVARNRKIMQNGHQLQDRIESLFFT